VSLTLPFVPGLIPPPKDGPLLFEKADAPVSDAVRRWSTPEGGEFGLLNGLFDIMASSAVQIDVEDTGGGLCLTSCALRGPGSGAVWQKLAK
jgi:hypothetical protein